MSTFLALAWVSGRNSQPSRARGVARKAVAIVIVDWDTIANGLEYDSPQFTIGVASVRNSNPVEVWIVDELLLCEFFIEYGKPHDWESGEDDVIALVEPALIQCLSTES